PLACSSSTFLKDPSTPRGPSKTPSLAQFGWNNGPNKGRSKLLEAVTDPVERLDHVEIIVDGFELLAQPLDVAVDGAVVDIDLIVVGGIHQGVAAFHHAGAGGQRLQDQEFGNRQCDRLVFPGASVPL